MLRREKIRGDLAQSCGAAFTNLELLRVMIYKILSRCLSICDPGHRGL